MSKCQLQFHTDLQHLNLNIKVLETYEVAFVHTF